MRRLARALPLLLLPLTACSGGDDGESLEDQRAAYLEKAEAVCKGVNDELEAKPMPTDIPSVPAYVDEVVALLERTVQEVTAIEPPAADAERLREQVLDPIEADVPRAQAYAQEVKAAAAANDGPTLLRLVQDRPQTSADLDYMREYGFQQCVLAADTSS